MAEDRRAPKRNAPKEELPARPLAPTELRYLVVAAQREGNRLYARRVAPLGLTPSHAEVLLVLSQFGPMSLRDLGEMIVCEAGSPSRIVDRLVQRELLDREIDPTDRRAIRVTLTEAGRELIPALRRIEREMDQLTADLLDDQQKVVVAGALRGFLRHSQAGRALERRFTRASRSRRTAASSLSDRNA